MSEDISWRTIADPDGRKFLLAPGGRSYEILGFAQADDRGALRLRDAVTDEVLMVEVERLPLED